MEQKASEGLGESTPQAGGEREDNHQQSEKPDLETQSKEQNPVKYETYHRAVTEAKKAKSRLAELETAEKKRVEDEQLKNGEYQKLLASRDEEIQDLRTHNTEKDRILQDGLKMDAFLAEVKGKVERQYWGLVDLESIAVDPETGTPDVTSVVQSARGFEEKYSRVIAQTDGPNLPSNAAQGGGKSLSPEEWKSLPLADKKKRYDEVKWSI